MARRRRSFVRRVRARAAGAFRRARRYSRSEGGGLMMTAAGAGIYGAAREKLSQALEPITSKVPLGNIADEVVLGAAGYLVAKKTNIPLLKSVGRAAMTIEAARIGEAIANGAVGIGGGTAPQTSSYALGR